MSESRPGPIADTETDTKEVGLDQTELQSYRLQNRTNHLINHLFVLKHNKHTKSNLK